MIWLIALVALITGAWWTHALMKVEIEALEWVNASQRRELEMFYEHMGLLDDQSPDERFDWKGAGL